MRREKRIHNFVIISIVMVSILIVTFIGFLVSRANNTAKENEFASELSKYDKQSESASTKIGRSVDEIQDEEFEAAEIIDTPKNDSNNTNTIETTKADIVKESEEKENKKSEAKEAKEDVKIEKEEKPEFDAPIKGEIIREFAKDSLVFSNTLQEWITHSAVDIKADKTSVVKSAASGTVSAIKNDPRYGLTVIVNHNGGYQTVYSNLLTAEFVVKGENVEKGQSIGTVGNTASFEISDDYHLHFELQKDNEPLDPTLYMEF